MGNTLLSLCYAKVRGLDERVLCLGLSNTDCNFLTDYLETL